MSVIGWIILGLIAGFISSRIVNHRGSGMLMDIIVGIVGAFIGGLVFNAFGARGVTGFNLWSIVVAIAGSVLLLGVVHALTGGGHRRLT
jgi:uncharacterized membrane protein YeaQ/YmgE (transglycosylase-associated protein family)